MFRRQIEPSQKNKDRWNSSNSNSERVTISDESFKKYDEYVEKGNYTDAFKELNKLSTLSLKLSQSDKQSALQIIKLKQKILQDIVKISQIATHSNIDSESKTTNFNPFG